jgi:hypothetical protein
MSDRFDLEQKIIQTTNFADLLRDLSRAILEEDKSVDEITTALEGLAILIDCHERSLFYIFTEVFNLDTNI